MPELLKLQHKRVKFVNKKKKIHPSMSQGLLHVFHVWEL